MDRAKLKKELERDEGRRLVAYKDTGLPPNWTIGVGHLLGSSPRMSSITDAECDALLDYDIDTAVRLARSLLVIGFDDMTDARQRALVNMAFNRGNHLTQSTRIMPAVRLAAQTGRPSDWCGVERAIAGTPWAIQVGERAARLGQMFASGSDAS